MKEEFILDLEEKYMLSLVKKAEPRDVFLVEASYLVPCFIGVFYGYFKDPTGPWVLVGAITFLILQVRMLWRRAKGVNILKSAISKLEQALVNNEKH